MTYALPAALLEEIFASEAPLALPVQDAEIGRNDHGTLTYCWPSPCEAVGSLWVAILDDEVMLSTRIFHKHVDRHDYEVRMENAADHDLPLSLVRAAIAEVAAILNGERIFSITYDKAGNISSYGMSPRHRWCIDNAGGSNRDPAKERFWDWFGEVATA